MENIDAWSGRGRSEIYHHGVSEFGLWGNSRVSESKPWIKIIRSLYIRGRILPVDVEETQYVAHKLTH